MRERASPLLHALPSGARRAEAFSTGGYAQKLHEYHRADVLSHAFFVLFCWDCSDTCMITVRGLDMDRRGRHGRKGCMHPMQPFSVGWHSRIHIYAVVYLCMQESPRPRPHEAWRTQLDKSDCPGLQVCVCCEISPQLKCVARSLSTSNSFLWSSSFFCVRCWRSCYTPDQTVWFVAQRGVSVSVVRLCQLPAWILERSIMAWMLLRGSIYCTLISYSGRPIA